MGGVLENFCNVSILLYMIYRALHRFCGGSLDFWWLIHENVEGGNELYLTQTQAAQAHDFSYTL